ncbi:MAG: FAD-binding oxidoreductase [Dehalococcoidia bacterium]|jgi:NAD(P)H-flavin reductase|nr:FAD-binding oxidoreductase [Dehalococcoidia bacterium]
MADDATLADTGSPRGQPNPGLPKAMLVERRDITEDLMVIKLEPEDGPLKFKPSQYCTLGLDGIERAYSIASAPHEPLLEIFVELVPEGALTPRMFRMQVGDCMSIRPRAKGLFTMNQKVHHHYMVSTVTGVAPTVSILRDYLHRGAEGHKFYALMGASYHDEFAYDKELAGLAAEHPGFITFVPTVSRPNEERNAGWTGATGRANAIAEEYLQRFNLPMDDTMIYACGHPGMIEDLKEKFVPKGWKFKEERFWKQ